MTTFYDIIYKIKAALDADPRVNTVSYGTLDLQALDKHNTYSLSHFNVTNTSFTSNMIEITINIMCMDILSIEKEPDFSTFERKDNTYDVLNTQYSILNRLFSQFERGSFVDDGFKLVGDPVSSPFMVRFNDHVAGWESDFVISVPNNMSICGEKTFNTYIGGGYINYPTKQDIATAIGILDTEISDFTRDGNDIKFNVDDTYNIDSSAFNGDRDIISYLDHDGLVRIVGSSAFFGCRGLEEVKFLKATSAGTSTFRATHLRKFSAPELLSVGSFCFRDNYVLSNVNIPSVTGSIGDTASFNNVFTSCKPGLSLITSVEMSIVNGGNPDGDIDYVLDTLNGSVTYV
jgi:hypothetical protein